MRGNNINNQDSNLYPDLHNKSRINVQNRINIPSTVKNTTLFPTSHFVLLTQIILFASLLSKINVINPANEITK